MGQKLNGELKIEMKKGILATADRSKKSSEWPLYNMHDFEFTV